MLPWGSSSGMFTSHDASLPGLFVQAVPLQASHCSLAMLRCKYGATSSSTLQQHAPLSVSGCHTGQVLKYPNVLICVKSALLP